ncbi:MAG: tetratricopeptide repeat protein [Acidiferrobacterales bacterium]
MNRSFIIVAVALLAFPLGAGAYGPFDYTNPEHVREKLPIVEQYHFNINVENLTGTMPGGSIGDHLWYVIRSFPNHHRALNAMARLWRESLQEGRTPRGLDPEKTPDFLFYRAMRFAPHDGVVPLLYAIHLHRMKKYDQALKMYKRAEELLPRSAELHYNLGLLYVARREYGLALSHARQAYKLGYPLPGLKTKLIAAGVWKE